MRRICPLSVVLLSCLLFGRSPAASAAEANHQPFVSGFERFGVHGEIDASDAGRLLISELSCTACHASNDSGLAAKGGPRLDTVGSRLQRDYLVQFLTAPHATKPGTTMPDVLVKLPAPQRQTTVEALAAFLSSLQAPFPTIQGSGANPVPYRFWEQGDPENGRVLYHKVGCVACHQPEEDYETAEIKPSPLDAMLEQLDPEELQDLGLSGAARRVASVPHGELPKKYTQISLTHFLLDPDKTRPAGRMPNMKLLVVEAADIAAYLLAGQKETKAAAELQTGDSGNLIAAGRKHFVALGCANCHTAGDLKTTLAASPLASFASVDKGCVADADPLTPRYGLSKLQTESIAAAVATLDNSAPSAATRLQSQMLQMNCYACHNRDELGGVGRYRKAYFETVGHVDLGDEGRLPPPLSHVGRKLHTTWLTKVLQGKNADLRPHMEIRMPVFPGGITKSLVPLLTEVDQASSRSADQVFGDTRGLAAAGRQLMDVGCVQCHQFAGDSLPGIVGIDLDGIGGRIRPQWFHDFLLNPGSLKKQTRMPTFFPDGTSSNPTILEGDPERQIAAIWAYLSNISKHGLPEKIKEARAQDYELVPKERPIVLRTFMQHAGRHAIAIGFPEGMHYAFDAEAVHPAVAWRGRFLDAQGTWFIRMAPPANPLGQSIITFPDGPLLAVLKDLNQPWPEIDTDSSKVRFAGYRLDSAGVPSMLYRWNGLAVQDRIQPDGDRGLRRTIQWKEAQGGAVAATEETLWLRAGSGKSLTRTDDGGFVDDQGLQIQVSEADRGGAQLRSWKEHQEYLVPISADQESVELWYRW